MHQNKNKEIDEIISNLRTPSMPTTMHRAKAALEIHQFAEKILSSGGNYEQILYHPDMLDFMMQFRGIMDNAKPGELDELTIKFSGFYHFAKTLEDLAVAIKEGRIKVP